MCERTRSLVRAGAVDDQRLVVDRTDDPGGVCVERPWMVRGRLGTPGGGTSRYPRPRRRPPTGSRHLVHVDPTPARLEQRCFSTTALDSKRPSGPHVGRDPGLEARPEAHPAGHDRKAGTPRWHRVSRRPRADARRCLYQYGWNGPWSRAGRVRPDASTAARPPRSVGVDQLADRGDLPAQVIVDRDLPVDLVARVQDRRVVPATELGADAQE